MQIQSKIVHGEFLASKTRQVRSVGKKVVMCYGSFELYHAGHVDLLEKAKLAGDMLVVVLEEDSECLYPDACPKNERLLLVASHECVDYVTVGKINELVELIKPDFVITSYKGRSPEPLPEFAHIVKAYGGKFTHMPRTILTDAGRIATSIAVVGEIF